MAHTKPASKRRRRSKALPVLGAAGLSLSLASGASAVPAGPALPTQNTIEVGQNITLGEEEIADVSLATFYVFDKENDGTSGPLQRVGHGCGGCGGHGHGCGGCIGIGIACGCGGCGGCGGCSGGYWCWINGVRTWCSYGYGY